MATKLIIVLTSAQLFLLWVYMLLNREKHNISISENSLHQYGEYLIYSLILTTTLFLLISFVIYKTYIKPDTSERFIRIAKKLEPVYKFLEKLNIFYTAYDIIFKFFGTGSSYVLFIVALAERILDYSDKKNLVIIFCFVSLPRIIIVLVFFSEIWSGHLHYYFYSLYLLLIPLVFRFILFSLKEVHERVFPEANAMVIQESSLVTINGKEHISINYKLKPEFDDMDPNTFLPELYFPLFFLEGHLYFFSNLYRKFHLFTVLLYQISHIAGFSYMLLLI